MVTLLVSVINCPRIGHMRVEVNDACEGGQWQ